MDAGLISGLIIDSCRHVPSAKRYKEQKTESKRKQCSKDREHEGTTSRSTEEFTKDTKTRSRSRERSDTKRKTRSRSRDKSKERSSTGSRTRSRSKEKPNTTSSTDECGNRSSESVSAEGEKAGVKLD